MANDLTVNVKVTMRRGFTVAYYAACVLACLGVSVDWLSRQLARFAKTEIADA